MPDRIGKKGMATEARLYGFIQASTATDDGRGGEALTWAATHIAPHAFAVSPISARQIAEYASINVEATHIIKIRAEIAIAEKNRIVINNRVFEVLTVEDIQERGILKVITCKERRS
jgi:SPP1 family predicted phage head-tail adaptor